MLNLKHFMFLPKYFTFCQKIPEMISKNRYVWVFVLRWRLFGECFMKTVRFLWHMQQVVLWSFHSANRSSSFRFVKWHIRRSITYVAQAIKANMMLCSPVCNSDLLIPGVHVFSYGYVMMDWLKIHPAFVICFQNGRLRLNAPVYAWTLTSNSPTGVVDRDSYLHHHWPSDSFCLFKLWLSDQTCQRQYFEQVSDIACGAKHMLWKCQPNELNLF